MVIADAEDRYPRDVGSTEKREGEMNEVHEVLLKLQELDREISAAQDKVAAYEPELERIEAPVLALEKEVEELEKRLEELRTQIRRRERGAADNQAELERYQERLERVRNPREEAAARTEIDLRRRAVETDEHEALELMEQATRTELRLDAAREKLAAARDESAPQREELLEGRDHALQELDVLRDQRENQTVRMDNRSRRLYEHVRSGRTSTVLTSITPDGACGHCFSLIPIQKQAEIRRANELIRCEACGVILFIE